MARKTTKSSASAGPAKSRRRRNVRAVTIDLEATEVGEEVARKIDPEPEPDPIADADSRGGSPAQPAAADIGAAGMGEDAAGPGPIVNTGIPVVTYLKYGAAGLAGGVLALLIYSGLARFGLAPIPVSADSSELTGSLDQLRQSVVRQETDWATRFSQIETRLSGLAANGPGTDLTARLDQLEAGIAALDSQIAAIDIATLQRLNQDQEALNSKVAALTERLDAAASNDGTGPKLAGLEARLGVLEANTESLLADLQAAASGGEGAGIAGTDLLALRQSLTSLQASANETRAQLTARMDGLDNIIQAAGATSVALAARVDDIQSSFSQRVDSVEARISELPSVQFTSTGTGAEARAAASLAFAALDRAVREGRPYDSELELLTSITESIPDNIVATLAAGSVSGVPTVADLTKQFETVANAIIEAEAGAGDTGLLDQTLTRIRSVVRIRPTGFVEGDGVPAIVARTEAYLDTGQLRAAIDELAALEGPAGEAAAGWFGAATTRLDTGDALVALNRFLLGNAGPAETSENQ
jgi:hypothetical protein